MDTAYTYVYLLLGDTHIHSNYLIYEINNFHELRLYWYMQLIIPCSSVTYDFLGTWSVKYDFIGTWSVTYDFIGTTDEHGIINCMYQ
jgi:hypothetical protein